MDLSRFCSDIKERVARDLERERDPLAREELLLNALYEVGREVLPALGTPRKSQQYLEAREAVLELVTRIAIPLMRQGGGRGVTVLSQLAEECQDPLLKRKLSVYAQELRAKGRPGEKKVVAQAARGLVPVLALAAAAGAALVLLEPSPPPGSAVPPRPLQGNAAPAEPEPLRAVPADPSPGDRPVVQAQPPPPPEPQKAERQLPAAQGEQVTRVRVSDNQVLVPVLLKQGGMTVRLDLLLDTGATRTTLHEGVATRLQIDLRSARPSQAETADGRVIRSKAARIDLLSVGPFSHPSLEVELIPYLGGERRHDGLLGMDVLGKHRYQIDMEHELIRWY